MDLGQAPQGVLLAGGAFLAFKSLVNVKGTEIGIVERKYLGKALPQGRVIASKGQVGIQARTLEPGLKVFVPFLYNFNKCQWTVIAKDEVGIIEARDGRPVPPGRIFGKVVPGHDCFQDGEKFLEMGGEKGPQTQILPPGSYRINPELFMVKKEKNIIIKEGQVGLVTAQDGQPMAPGRLLAKRVDGHNNFEDGQKFIDAGGEKGPQIDVIPPGEYRVNTELFKVRIVDATVIPANQVGLVTALDGEQLPAGEYVAKEVQDHDDYQNAAAFLSNGGQRGPQLSVLRPGTYYINTLMFKVELDSVAEVQRGQVAVLVSNVGKEPNEEILKADPLSKEVAEQVTEESEARLKNGVERYVVPAGYRGIQNEVSGPGRYYLNRRAHIAYIVETTNLTIDWDNDDNTRFDPLSVISKDGFAIQVSVKVVVRVKPEQAPYMVSRIGSLENLIDHVVHPLIDSSFRNQASSTSAMNFMQNRQDEQRKAEDHARTELEKYFVECVSVLICQIKLPQELMDTQTKKIIAEQEKAMYNAMRDAEQERIATDKTKAEADQQADLVKAEIGVKVAEQEKQKKVIEAEAEKEKKILEAEGEAASIQKRGEAEAGKITAIGMAVAEAYQKQTAALGQDAVKAIEIVKMIAEKGMKLTPDFYVGGGDSGGNSGLLSTAMVQLISGKGNLGTMVAARSAAPAAESESRSAAEGAAPAAVSEQRTESAKEPKAKGDAGSTTTRNPQPGK